MINTHWSNERSLGSVRLLRKSSWSTTRPSLISTSCGAKSSTRVSTDEFFVWACDDVAVAWNFAYKPPNSISASGNPCSPIPSRVKTITWSALFEVAALWVIQMIVLFTDALSRAVWTASSLYASKAAVASSRIKILGFPTTARL